jgi:hypothetical protein
VRLEWRDLEKIQCNASALLCGQRVVADAEDFTDRYREEEEEEEELTQDSNISCYILAENGLTVYNASTLKNKLVFQIYLPLYRQQSTEL